MKLSPFLLPLLLLCQTPATARLINQTWVISLSFIYPDGVQKVLPVVNGQFPGPELRCHVNDTVQITVVNRLPSDTTSIHWHGIKQKGSPWADGVPDITQCPILPGQSFVYKFTLDTPGTLWWHSHTAFQKSSLYGAIIVKGDEDKIGNFSEFTILLNDWFHTPPQEQIAGLFQPADKFIWVGDPNSLLINGRGTPFDCNLTNKKCNTTKAPGPQVIMVKPNTAYRVRVIGASSLSFLNLAIDVHNVTVVEVETTLVQKLTTQFLDVSPGQSYSVLLKTKKESEIGDGTNNGLFWIQTDVRHRNFQNGSRGLAILSYGGATDGSDRPLQDPGDLEFPGREDVDWSLSHARDFRALEVSPLPTPRRTVTILGTQNILPSDGRKVWAMNNISFVDGGSPLLHSMVLRVRQDLEEWTNQTSIPNVFDYTIPLENTTLGVNTTSGTHVMEFKRDEIVDFVFQNTVALNGKDELHPWHLHMHNFWVLAYGDFRKAWSETDVERYETRRAVSRNTFTLYPGSWTAIRVKFDNPGVAHFHCHILAHVVMGMGFAVRVGEAEDIQPLPPGTPFCGTVTELMRPPILNR